MLSKLESIQVNSKFGKWTVLDEITLRGNSKYFTCRCDCGLPQKVNGYDLLRGKTNQCKSCRTTQRNLKHGQNQHGQITYEYRLWQQLKHKKLLCPDWRDSFEIFFKDVGKRPNDNFILLKNTHYPFSMTNFYWGHPRLKFFKDIKNTKIGDWTILEEDLLGHRIRWLCQCKCGRKDYIPQYNLLKRTSKKCKSCAAPKHKKTHGESKNSLYKIYHGIKRRCYCKTVKCYKHYGGRGIKMCQRWLDSFENFYQDMYPKPSPRHSLDRINNDGDYCPENCKWSTQKEQTNNRRSVNQLQIEINKLNKKLKFYQNYIRVFVLLGILLTSCDPSNPKDDE